MAGVPPTSERRRLIAIGQHLYDEKLLTAMMGHAMLEKLAALLPEEPVSPRRLLDTVKSMRTNTMHAAVMRDALAMLEQSGPVVASAFDVVVARFPVRQLKP